MKSRFSFPRPLRPLAVAAFAAVLFGACDEQIDGGAACPALCPNPPGATRDTTLFAAVDLDTTISGFPTLGAEVRLFIASMGDTLLTYGVARYDSLPGTFRHTNSATDSVITVVDTGAYVTLPIVAADTLGGATTVELYDVDLFGVDDSDPLEPASAFTPDRLLGTKTFPASALKDSIKVPINPDKLLAMIQKSVPENRLRLGIKVAGTGQNHLSVLTSNALGSNGPYVVFRPSLGDTTVPVISVRPRSKFPADEPFTAGALADYLIVVTGPPPPLANTFRIGGLPARRTYLRFNIPDRLIDSSSVVRASLILTQAPRPGAPLARDSIAIQQLGVVASAEVTDLARALLLATQIRLGAVDTVRTAPRDTGLVSFEMIDLVRTWRGTKAAKTPRALALRSTVEGGLPQYVDFFSMEAPASVRPQLKITYVPRVPPGL